MAQFLSAEQNARFRECFELYDKKHINQIKGMDLVTCMRSLGYSPTIWEGQKYLKNYDKGFRDYISFDQFLEIMNKHLNQENPAKEVQKAFKLSDKMNRGFIGAQELAHILMHTGERLTHREVAQMFKSANIQANGYVRYDDFIRMLTLPIPEV